MTNVRADDEQTFKGKIEVVRVFRGRPEIVDAEVSYSLNGGGSGMPEFRSVTIDGKPVPLSYATKSSLLKAYARHRSVDI